MANNRYSDSVPYPDPDRPFQSVMIPVSCEIKKEITRDNDRIRKKAQYHGRCHCPRQQIKYCTGDCVSCKYQAVGDIVSLDYNYTSDKSDEPVSLHEILEDRNSSKFPEDIAEKDLINEIRNYLEHAMPEAWLVLIMQIYDNLSERQALEKLGIPRSTYRSRWDIVRNDLIVKFGQDLF